MNIKNYKIKKTFFIILLYNNIFILKIINFNLFPYIKFL